MKQCRPARLPLIVTSLDLIDDGSVFALDIFVHDIRVVLPDHRHVRGDDHNVQIVDFPELRFFRQRGSGHTGKLVIKPEVILESYGCKGFSFPFNFNLFLASIA